MEIKTYGANKIGGCITEIQSGSTKIIFDYGTNLDYTPQIDIEGLTYGKPKYEAVFISHYHLDHIGEIDKLLDGITIYVEETTKKLYDIICDFLSKPRVNVKTFKFNKDIELSNDIKVRAFKVDHSAYNSAMFLIDDGKERAIYTGDFRSNGYSGNKLLPTFRSIGKVDYLITEGTNIGNDTHIIRKEQNLVKDFATIMKKYNQVFVLMSSSNIDRVTTILKACNKTKHTLIEDIYMAHLTSTIFKEDRINIPNPVSYDNVMVYKPLYFNKKDDEFKSNYLNCFSEKNNNTMLYKPFTINVRTSMLSDLRMFKRKHILTNCCLIYSMWGGYKEQEDIVTFIREAKRLGITLIKKELHTTGHASKELINKVVEITGNPQVVMIHTNFPINDEIGQILDEQTKQKITNIYGLIFWNYQDNTFITPKEINAWLRRLNIKYKITDKLHNHRLRHTRITRWKEQGVDMNAIQYLAGHVEGSEITDKVYIDVSENFAFKQLEKVI